MKIIASKRDDLLKQREEYDAKRAAIAQREDEADKAFRQADYAAAKAVEKAVSDMIGNTTLQLDVRADTSWRSFATDEPSSWRITVSANDRDHFDKARALSWHWEVDVDKQGNLVKDSGSWSGLRAVTEEQLADLEESVRILKLLNNADWSGILHMPMVKWSDYFDKGMLDEKHKLDRERPDFESELIAAQLEDILNGNTAVGLKQDSYFRGSDIWILPTKISDKFITGYIFPGFYFDRDGGATVDKIKQWSDERRTSKSNIRSEKGDLIVRTLAE